MLPIPPLAFRQIVGPTEVSFYDNPTGDRIWGDLDLDHLEPGEAYDRIFDFGCGCGRVARQLLMQNQPPSRYVGVDIHSEMIKWCKKHLGSPSVEFHFHNVWNPTYAPRNKKNRTLPLAHHGSDFTLINAHSVFTHTYADQTEYYLSEFVNMLDQNGIIRSTWFIFNRDWFPMLSQDQHCLFVNEHDPTQAVYYDWNYILRMIKNLGLRLIAVNWTDLPGFQSELYLAHAPSFRDLADEVVPSNKILGFGESVPPEYGN